MTLQIEIRWVYSNKALRHFLCICVSMRELKIAKCLNQNGHEGIWTYTSSEVLEKLQKPNRNYSPCEKVIFKCYRFPWILKITLLHFILPELVTQHMLCCFFFLNPMKTTHSNIKANLLYLYMVFIYMFMLTSRL